MPESHSVIVVGAGLSGLYAAWQLQQQQVDVIVLEARKRAGGRILSCQADNHVESYFDMGPAWFWPAFQPRMNQLITSLGLEMFRQHTLGDLLFEVDTHNLTRHAGPSSHNQSFRLSGGNHQLINALVQQLDDSSVRLNQQVKSIRQMENGLLLHTSAGNQETDYQTDQVILALPPRVILQRIELTPDLPYSIQHTWQSIPTWMAGHCKMIFVYEKPFWREQGLSGEVFSHYGPLSEIYDASPLDEECFALSAFVKLNAQQRQQISIIELEAMCLAQLNRLFGEASQAPMQILTRDWSNEQFTAIQKDSQGVPQHPAYPSDLARNLWSDQLILAGTECAMEHGGYLEGALESAQQALSHIKP